VNRDKGPRFYDGGLLSLQQKHTVTASLLELPNCVSFEREDQNSAMGLDSDRLLQTYALISLARSQQRDLNSASRRAKVTLKTMSLTKGSGYRCATNLGAVFHIRVSAPTRCSETLDLRAEVESYPPNITCPEPLMSLNHSSLDNRNGRWKMGTCNLQEKLQARFRFRLGGARPLPSALSM